jgi:hypothetical protein
MLTLRLRQSLGNVEPRTAQCILAVDLEEFSQVFDSESKSIADLHACARLPSRGDQNRRSCVLSALRRRPMRPAVQPPSLRSPMGWRRSSATGSLISAIASENPDAHHQDTNGTKGTKKI